MKNCTEVVITRELKNAVRNCNRNIYEWLNGTKKRKVFTISHTEVRGLAKNWIIRYLKDVMGNIQTDRLLREGNLYVSVDDDNSCISYLDLSSTDNWRQLNNDIELVRSCMRSIDYKSLRYDPSEYESDGYTPKLLHFGDPSYIDLSSISKIKF